jgi:hypothetical protein
VRPPPRFGKGRRLRRHGLRPRVDVEELLRLSIGVDR